MYLLELQQGDRHHTVGLFRRREEAQQWIEAIPYVNKHIDVFEGQQFITYTMTFEDLPLYEEIVWKTSRYPLTKYMFTPDDGEINLFIWDELPVMSDITGCVDGGTQVDAYVVPNTEVESYILAREEVREAITSYYEKLGKRVETGGVGSEDGEYLTVENGPFIHLDALTVHEWQRKTSVEDFLSNLED